MDQNKIFAKIILFENSVFAAMTASRQMLDLCSGKCQRGIKNGPNYDFQVKCCTSACKIKAYTKLVATLQSLKGGAISEEVLNKKISYFSTQLQNEKGKYVKYRNQLKNRQTKVPVDLSLKPSPERWDPKKLN